MVNIHFIQICSLEKMNFGHFSSLIFETGIDRIIRGTNEKLM